jgi:hypothetical protein
MMVSGTVRRELPLSEYTGCVWEPFLKGIVHAGFSLNAEVSGGEQILGWVSLGREISAKPPEYRYAPS